MTDLDGLIAEAEMGEKAKAFMESELGKCIIGMAKQEAELAKEGLSRVDPDDKKAIVALQNHIWRAERFQEWLTELLDKGETAKQVFQQQTEQ